MERLGVLFSVICFFAILAGPVFSAPSTTEIPKADAASLKSKNAEDDADCPWVHVGHTRDAVQAGGELTRDSSRSKEGSVQEARHSKHTEDFHIDGVSRSNYQRGSAVGLSSHDTLPNPSPISAHTARQTKRSTGDYKNPTSSSVRNILDDIGRRSIESLRNSDLKDDIEVAEDRYPSQYPSPYWNQRQYSNQRYRPNDRRDPYRNYLRYPVFPGK